MKGAGFARLSIMAYALGGEKRGTELKLGSEGSAVFALLLTCMLKFNLLPGLLLFSAGCTVVSLAVGEKLW